MSIRINKAMGWGMKLAHRVTEDGTIRHKDPRLNRKHRFSGNKPLPTATEYEAWLREKEDARDEEGRCPYKEERVFMNCHLHALKVDKAQEMTSTVMIEGGALLLSPFYMPDWYRWDDALDHQEEYWVHGSDGPAPRISFMKAGIFPWCGSYMDPATGELEQFWVRERDGGEIVRVQRSTWRRPDRKVLAPSVPGAIKVLAEFAGLFVDHERTCLELRPMVLVWWD